MKCGFEQVRAFREHKPLLAFSVAGTNVLPGGAPNPHLRELGLAKTENKNTLRGAAGLIKTLSAF